MKEGQRLWTRDELILTMNLYWKIEFGKYHKGHPEVRKLAQIINRTPSAVALKLGNLASFDPSLQERGIKGAKNASKLDKAIWDEFFNNPEILPFESEKLKAEFLGEDLESIHGFTAGDLPAKGIEREALIKTRVNQNLFRQAVLSSYNGTCCITGISEPSFLIAGHITPWAKNEKQRMNPRNGLLINALHDKAFERGLLSIKPDYTIVISKTLLENEEEWHQSYFSKYHEQKMRLPTRFLPEKAFLAQHFEERFIN